MLCQINEKIDQFREQLVRDKTIKLLIIKSSAKFSSLSDEWRRELWEGCYVEYARSIHFPSNHYYSLTFLKIDWRNKFFKGLGH